MKIIDFKTVSPLFEMERDGIKPFTVRRYEADDARVDELFYWADSDGELRCRITNPATGESFTRRIIDWGWLSVQTMLLADWYIIHFKKVD